MLSNTGLINVMLIDDTSNVMAIMINDFASSSETTVSYSFLGFESTLVLPFMYCLCSFKSSFKVSFNFVNPNALHNV